MVARPVIHKARGRASNNGVTAGLREYALELVRARYADFGPTLATEMLLSKDGAKVSRETLRKWMIEEGVWAVPQAAPHLPPAAAPAREPG